MSGIICLARVRSEIVKLERKEEELMMMMLLIPLYKGGLKFSINFITKVSDSFVFLIEEHISFWSEQPSTIKKLNRYKRNEMMEKEIVIVPFDMMLPLLYYVSSLLSFFLKVQCQVYNETSCLLSIALTSTIIVIKTVLFRGIV